MWKVKNYDERKGEILFFFVFKMEKCNSWEKNDILHNDVNEQGKL